MKIHGVQGAAPYFATPAESLQTLIFDGLLPESFDQRVGMRIHSHGVATAKAARYLTNNLPI